MSMHNYAMNDFGMIVEDNEFDILITKMKALAVAEGTCEPDEDIGIDAIEYDDFMDCEHDRCYCTDVENPEFQTMEGEWHTLSEDFVFFSAFKGPKIIGVAYNSKEEILQEFKEDLGKYFPEDFDWEKHIGFVHGVLWA